MGNKSLAFIGDKSLAFICTKNEASFLASTVVDFKSTVVDFKLTVVDFKLTTVDSFHHHHFLGRAVADLHEVDAIAETAVVDLAADYVEDMHLVGCTVNHDAAVHNP